MRFFLTVDLKLLVIWMRDGEYVAVCMTLYFFSFSRSIIIRAVGLP